MYRSVRLSNRTRHVAAPFEAAPAACLCAGTPAVTVPPRTFVPAVGLMLGSCPFDAAVAGFGRASVAGPEASAGPAGSAWTAAAGVVSAVLAGSSLGVHAASAAKESR